MMNWRYLAHLTRLTERRGELLGSDVGGLWVLLMLIRGPPSGHLCAAPSTARDI